MPSKAAKAKKTARGHTKEDRLDEVLDKGADLRIQLDTELWPEFRAASIVFKDLFHEKRALMKLLSDMVYYQGGYPSPTSKPKAEDLGRKAASAFRMLNAIGRGDDLNKWFRAQGLEIVVRDPRKASVPLKVQAPTRKAQEFVKQFDLKPPKFEASAVLKWLVEFTCERQKVICQTANIIKKDLYRQAQVEIGEDSHLRKGHWRESVALRSRVKRTKGMEAEALSPPIPLPDQQLDAVREKYHSRSATLSKRGSHNVAAAAAFAKVSTVAVKPINEGNDE